MPDLSEQQSSQTVKVVGSDVDGNETNFVTSTDSSDGIKHAIDVAILQNSAGGSTIQSSGTVDTTGSNIPATPGNNYTRFIVSCKLDQIITHRLLVSLDGGTTFITLPTGGSIDWEPLGAIKQLFLKGNVASVAFELLGNRE